MNELRLFKLLIFAFIIFNSPSFAQNTEKLKTGHLDKVTLQLQWKYQFQFAGFIVAKELGFYSDAGLDVDILEYNNSNIKNHLEQDIIDYAVTNSMIFYENKRLSHLSLLATYFQRSPNYHYSA